MRLQKPLEINASGLSGAFFGTAERKSRAELARLLDLK
jgi:hypothetical protein